MNILPGLEEYFLYASGWIDQDEVFHGASDNHFAVVAIECALRVGLMFSKTLI